MKQLILLLALFPILAFAQTRQEVLKELHRQQVHHANIVLAQARLESGNFKSAFYRKTNNLFGLKKGKKYANYRHWKESILDYLKRVSSKYNKRKDKTYYDFLRRIGYARDKKYIEKLKEIVNENRIYTLCGY